MKSLEIKDLNKLKITKVKNYIIYFEYDNEKYFLKQSEKHNGYGYDDCITLNRKIYVNKNRYTLEIIYDKLIELSIYGEFVSKNWNNKKGDTYKNFDKEYFVKRLEYYGICHTLFKNYVLKLKEEEKRYDNKIKNAEVKVMELRYVKYNLIYTLKGKIENVN